MTFRRVLVLAAAWALLALALWASDARPALFVLGGVVAAIGSALFVLTDLADAVGGVEWTRVSRRPRDVRRPDPRVSSLRSKAQGSWWSGATDLGDTLVDLLDDRLLAHHHIDRQTDPQAAATLLTPALRSLVAAPRRSSMSPRELHELLTDIEAL